MKLTNEQNLAFMSDPRRIAAQKQLNEAVFHISDSVKSSRHSAGYYLTVLPPLLKSLAAAVENLTVVEAMVEAEIAGKI